VHGQLVGHALGGAGHGVVVLGAHFRTGGVGVFGCGFRGGGRRCRRPGFGPFLFGAVILRFAVHGVMGCRWIDQLHDAERELVAEAGLEGVEQPLPHNGLPYVAQFVGQDSDGWGHAAIALQQGLDGTWQAAVPILLGCGLRCGSRFDGVLVEGRLLLLHEVTP
jgi:hypothetical protein